MMVQFSCLPCPCFAYCFAVLPSVRRAQEESIATSELWFAYCKPSNTYHVKQVNLLPTSNKLHPTDPIASVALHAKELLCCATFG